MSHKPRVEELQYDPGPLVYYYRLMRPGKRKKSKPTWAGPATVIGREGANYCMARGGRCILVAPEHMRSAHHNEVSELLHTLDGPFGGSANAQKRGDLVDDKEEDVPPDATGAEERGSGDVTMEAEDALQGGQLVDVDESRVEAARREEEGRLCGAAGLLDFLHSVKKARMGWHGPPTKLWWLLYGFRANSGSSNSRWVDPCVFMLLGHESGRAHGLVSTHVDDLLLATFLGETRPCGEAGHGECALCEKPHGLADAGA